MQPERLSDPTYPMYMRTLTLYKASFPPHEQRQRISQDAVLRDGDYHFQLIYDRKSFVGLMLYGETEELVEGKLEARNRLVNTEKLERSGLSL